MNTEQEPESQDQQDHTPVNNEIQIPEVAASTLQMNEEIPTIPEATPSLEPVQTIENIAVNQTIEPAPADESSEQIPPAPIPIPAEIISRSNSRDRSKTESQSGSRSRSRSASRRNKRKQDSATKFYVGRIHTDTQEEDLKQSFSQFGEISEVKIIRKSYNGQPLRDTYYAFVVICLKVDTEAVLAYFESSLKEKGWIVKLAKEVASCNCSERQRRKPEAKEDAS